MTFKEAFELMGRDEAFKATVYAMNTLLIKKGVYSSEEFEQLFCEHALNFKNGFSGKAPKEIILETASETSHASR